MRLSFYGKGWWLVATCSACGRESRRSSVAWILEHWPGLTVGEVAQRLRCSNCPGVSRVPCGRPPADVWLEQVGEDDPEYRVPVMGVGTC